MKYFSAALLLLILGYILRAVLIPVLVALILAYILNPRCS